MKRFAVLSLAPLLCVIGLGFACDDGTGDEAPEGPMCGEEFVDPPKDETTPSIMDAWGAPCMVDADCEAGLGAGAVCVLEILGVFTLPGGYCTRECEVGATDVSFVLDDPECDPNGGVACVGVDGNFTACAPPCSSHSECGRAGYACVIMPIIGAEGDETFCLMNAEACCTDSGTCG